MCDSFNDDRSDVYIIDGVLDFELLTCFTIFPDIVALLILFCFIVIMLFSRVVKALVLLVLCNQNK